MNGETYDEHHGPLVISDHPVIHDQQFLVSAEGDFTTGSGTSATASLGSQPTPGGVVFTGHADARQFGPPTFLDGHTEAHSSIELHFTLDEAFAFHVTGNADAGAFNSSESMLTTFAGTVPEIVGVDGNGFPIFEDNLDVSGVLNPGTYDVFLTADTENTIPGGTSGDFTLSLRRVPEEGGTAMLLGLSASILAVSRLSVARVALTR